jgi:hypothetical protein
MLVESQESFQRSRAVISLVVNSDLAGPIFVKSLKFNIQVDFLVHKLNLKSLWKACGFQAFLKRSHLRFLNFYTCPSFCSESFTRNSSAAYLGELWFGFSSTFGQEDHKESL